MLPDAKLIVLLRDPVRRAYSHYWHERDKGRESLTFEDAIAAEPGRIDIAQARLADGALERSHEHQHFSYLARGRYAEQLERWFALFPRERFLILRFEDLVADPLAVLNQRSGSSGCRRPSPSISRRATLVAIRRSPRRPRRGCVSTSSRGTAGSRRCSDRPMGW